MVKDEPEHESMSSKHRTGQIQAPSRGYMQDRMLIYIGSHPDALPGRYVGQVAYRLSGRGLGLPSLSDRPLLVLGTKPRSSTI